MDLRAILVVSEKRKDNFSDEGSQSPQRRRTKRRSLKLEAVATPPSAGETQVVIRDISTGGLLMEADPAALFKDDCVEIDLPELGIVVARVAWQSGRFFGCEFSEHIPAGAISAALLKSVPEPKQDELVGDLEVEARSSGGRMKLNPELNFSVALVLSLALWAIIGAMVYLFME